RGCFREEPARRASFRVPAQAIHTQAACLQGEGDHGGVSMRWQLAVYLAPRDCCSLRGPRHGSLHVSDTDQPKPPQHDDIYVETPRDRRIANIVLLVILGSIVGGGIWLANAMFEQRQLDDCLAQGRRNCGPIETPSR